MKQSLQSRRVNSVVLIIDSLELRRAAVASLLKPWAEANGMEIADIDPQNALSQTQASSLRMVVLVLGAQGVSDPDPQNWIRSLCATYADIPLVLISDREETKEVVAAFEAGVRGFIPANLTSPVAIQAFTFIMNGGSFFPPIALMQAMQADRTPQIGGSKSLTVIGIQHRNGLTARQQEVLEHLQQGASNKLIGRQLRLRESTVKVHIRQIMRKLGATNRTQAALCAVQLSKPGAGSDSLASEKSAASPSESSSQVAPEVPRPTEAAGATSVRTPPPAGSFTIRARREQVLRQAALRSTPVR